ncbi:hypothetical protein [Amycolatopsis sp. cmx-11-51]|uniref:hypothetical protein n=1 Tax=unclassified Amycolatopsis TaxID=2618356 RepID=UPI0039E5DBAE
MLVHRRFSTAWAFPSYVYTESDEISILLDPAADLFGRGVEKLVSISARGARALRRPGLARHDVRGCRRPLLVGRNELLFAHGVDFAEVPTWQRHGVGLCWEIEVAATRRRRV